MSNVYYVLPHQSLWSIYTLVQNSIIDLEFVLVCIILESTIT